MTTLLEQSNIAEALLDAVTDSVTLIDRNLRIQFQNKLNLKFFGNQTGAHCFETFRGRTSPCDDCIVIDVIRDGKARRAVHDIELPNGDIVLMEVSATPLKEKDGAIVGAVEVARDITAQKKAEALMSELLVTKDETLRGYLKELNDAAGYIKTMLPPRLTDGPITTDWMFRPSADLGGDAFGYHWIDSDHFAMYLIDVSGHGWGAALLSVSIINVLRAQTLPQTNFGNPGQVLFNLNNAFPGELHNDLFFSIWYGVYDTSAGILTYATGGHPPALLMGRPNGGRPNIQTCHTPNFILGGQRDTRYRQDEIKIDGLSCLYIFSDGIYEFATRSKTIWGFDGLMQFMTRAIEDGWPSLDAILEHARQVSGVCAFEDDFTLLQVVFPR